MLDLQDQLGLTYLFVAHDLSVVKHGQPPGRGHVRRPHRRNRAHQPVVFQSPPPLHGSVCYRPCRCPIRGAAPNGSCWRVTSPIHPTRHRAARSILVANTRRKRCRGRSSRFDRNRTRPRGQLPPRRRTVPPRCRLGSIRRIPNAHMEYAPGRPHRVAGDGDRSRHRDAGRPPVQHQSGHWSGHRARRVGPPGIRYVDTAPFYGVGAAEHRVGDALREEENRDAWVLSTKVGRLLKPHPGRAQHHDGTADCRSFPSTWSTIIPMTESCARFEDSYQRLGLAKIDILFVHDIGLVTPQCGRQYTTI